MITIMIIIINVQKMVWIFLHCLENYQKYPNNLGNIFRKFQKLQSSASSFPRCLTTHNVTATLDTGCNIELDKIVYGMLSCGILSISHLYDT